MEAKSRGLTESSKKAQARKGLDVVDVTNCTNDFFTNNCETYVTKWKYTFEFSEQVHTLWFKLLL